MLFSFSAISTISPYPYNIRLRAAESMGMNIRQSILRNILSEIRIKPVIIAVSSPAMNRIFAICLILLPVFVYMNTPFCVVWTLYSL